MHYFAGNGIVKIHYFSFRPNLVSERLAQPGHHFLAPGIILGISFDSKVMTVLPGWDQVALR